MIVELALLGLFVGTLSGFFGIGGGTILVPALLLIGFDIKTAIGISVLQMVFASVYGSYLNLKKGTLPVGMTLLIGLGGFAGALTSPLIVSMASDRMLEGVFLGFVLFALSRLFLSTPAVEGRSRAHPVVLFLIGGFIGTFSISIGVGGSILLVPILVGFLHVPIKNAISAGLFFVVFSSVSGLIGLSAQGMIDYEKGVLVGIASMAGVALGIWLKHRSSDVLQKRLLIGFYIGVAAYLLYRLVEHGQ
jgi:uncharacterized membrane protein YfcA